MKMQMKLMAVGLLLAVRGQAGTMQPLWPSLEAMPDRQDRQYAAPARLVKAGGFDFAAHRMPYLEWMDAPSGAKTLKGCVIFLPGGGYGGTHHDSLSAFGPIQRRMELAGFQCAYLWYRVPRPKNLAIYQSAWEDGQRAVRLVRAAAKARGYDAENIGVIGFSAGAHLAVLLGANALTPAYAKVDGTDELSCHVNWAMPMSFAYGVNDGLDCANRRGGVGAKMDPRFRFDAKTCPMCFFHGEVDPYSPLSATRAYRELRKRKVPAELHLDGGRSHGIVSQATFERGVEFLCQLGFLGSVPAALGDKQHPYGFKRFPDDSARAKCVHLEVWPQGKMPDVQTNQCVPFIEWNFPKTLKTRAIQILYSGGGYRGSTVDGSEVCPLRRYLNEKGMTVVALRYRTPRPVGIPMYVTAWQDLQRTIRLVKRDAAKYGLDPERIGIGGYSAGGHLTLLGALSSQRAAYAPIDELDRTPCNVQWAVAIYPAYALTEGTEFYTDTDGNDDKAVLSPILDFDAATPPMCFIHGDADGVPAMGSVKVWEKLREMGRQSDLHTLATRGHCFQHSPSPGTGSITWMDRVWEFLSRLGH